SDCMAACNFARRLKTLSGLTPYEYICKISTSEPDRFILNPIHQMPGLNTMAEGHEQTRTVDLHGHERARWARGSRRMRP
ncbi:hypothetical protein C357_19176, partial [Citreicella sp. 357]